MAEEQKTRIINLSEKTAPDSGDFFAVDSQAGGSKKVPTTALAKAADLTAEAAARTQADNALTSAINSASALIQNPTKTLSGALVSFTDGADMPMVACTAEIVPKQSGTGTPSPDNVRPISGWESVNVYDTGKNLLEVSMTDGEVSGVTYTKNADGSISCSGTITGTSAKYISSTASMNALKTGVPYVLTGGDEVSVDGIRVVSSIKNADGSVARWIDVTTASGYTFTLSEGQTLTSIYLRGATTGTAVNVTIRPMIRLASDTDPTYEPYTGTTTTTDLGRTVYGGTLDVVSGVLTVDRVGVDMGTLSWANYKSGGFKASLAGAIGSTGAIDDPALMTSMYRTYSFSTTLTNGMASITGGSLYCVNSDYTTDAAAFKNGMSGQTAVYKLANPQTYTLTGQEVSTLLGENNVWADSGDVEITYRRDISIVLENLENALSGSNSLNTMMMSAPTGNTAEEPTEDEAEDDMR